MPSWLHRALQQGILQTPAQIEHLQRHFAFSAYWNIESDHRAGIERIGRVLQQAEAFRQPGPALHRGQLGEQIAFQFRIELNPGQDSFNPGSFLRGNRQ